MANAASARVRHNVLSRIQVVVASLTLAGASVLGTACTPNEPIGGPPSFDDGGPATDAEAGRDAHAPEDTASPGDAAPPTDTPHAPDAAQVCDFAARYEYGEIGGLRALVNRSQLAPGNMYSYSRTTFGAGGATRTCSPPMPTCGALDVITAYDIEVHDLARDDVQAALAEPTPPLFGQDDRPVDGVVFEFKRADGRGFLVGGACVRAGPCRPIPAGISQVRQRLLDLDRQQLTAPECQGLSTR
jgi:hypothetical protein